MIIIIFHKKINMASMHFCFGENRYIKYSAEVALRQTTSGNYLGILLNKGVKSVFVCVDAMLALVDQQIEISEGIAESVTKFDADKKNYGPKFQTIYQNIFYERSYTQYRVEMVAQGQFPPLFGVAMFFIPEGCYEWSPTKFSVFVPKYIWDRFYKKLPKIISALTSVMSARKGVRLIFSDM